MGGANPADATSTTEHKLYVPVVILSINDNIRFLEKNKVISWKNSFLEQR